MTDKDLKALKEQDIKNQCFMSERSRGYRVAHFKAPRYETAFIGMTEDCRAAYDYDAMIEYLVHYDRMGKIEAADFIRAHLKTTPAEEGRGPVIIHRIGK